MFALGRAGFLAPALGTVHAERRTPVAAVLACSLLTAGFVVANVWFDQVIGAAVLVAGAAALVLYLLGMWALFRLRRREPELLKGYRAPLGWWLPLVGVPVLSAIALAVYYRIDPTGVVVPVAVGTYALGIAYFALRGRKRVTASGGAGDPASAPVAGRRSGWLHRAAVASLVLALGGMGAVAVAALGGPSLLGAPDDVSAAVVLGVVAERWSGTSRRCGATPSSRCRASRSHGPTSARTGLTATAGSR